MTTTSKNKLLITSTIAALAVIGGGMGYFLYKQGQQLELLQTTLITMQQTEAKVSTNTPILDAEAFEKAVEKTIENRILREKNRVKQERLQSYSLASNDIPDDKHIYGNYNARFTLVEFSDIECPYCKRFHDTPKSIVDQSKGHVNWQWKHLPLSFHNPVAELEAQATECVADIAGNQMFWVYLDELFKQTRGSGQGADILGVADTLGIDKKALQVCLDSGKFQEKVQGDIAQATKMGINGTPATFLVDNQTGKNQLLSGAQPEQAFIAAIRKMMAESEETIAEKEE